MKKYVSISVIFILSGFVYALLPDAEYIKALGALPLVGSLLFALFQLARDQAEFSRKKLLLEIQNDHGAGLGSHMANVTFDKYVLFAEEYAMELDKTLVTLFTEGPTESALKHANDFYRLQRKHALWITPKISQELNVFESSLRKMGASANYVNKSEHSAKHDQHSHLMSKLHADIMGEEFMGIEWQNEPLNKQIAIATIMSKLRLVLGTEELTELRTQIVRNATSRLKKR
jgi:hypothetical protein